MVALVPVVFAAPAGAQQQLQEAVAQQAQVDRTPPRPKPPSMRSASERKTPPAATRKRWPTRRASSASTASSKSRCARKRKRCASIEQQLLEIETTNREVQPLMQQMVDTLARFIELDVPFYLEERTARVQNLKNLMPRADVAISEKYRLILEAYQIELDYGQTLEAYEGRLGAGADARTVEFVHLGRVSLMYRTLDGSETGYWDANQKTWVVDESYAEAVEEAIRVARDDGAPDLLTVPVPAPQEVRS